MDYDNTNSGALFKDERKSGDTDRDYSGSLDVGGVGYWISGWVKTSSKTGKKFLSLKVKPKAETSRSREDMNDNVPF
jgi:hypothetical protein